jgi:uncharacterized membrane protein
MVPFPSFAPAFRPPPLAWSVTAVRTLHVLAAAVVLGGSLLVAVVVRGASTPADRRGARRVAVGYERLFWGAFGLLAATGVGNLGALAPAIPGGSWGAALAAKLLVVLAVLAGSLVRTLAVVRCRERDASVTALAPAYALTALALGTAVVLAEVLAHG